MYTSNGCIIPVPLVARMSDFPIIPTQGPHLVAPLHILFLLYTRSFNKFNLETLLIGYVERFVATTPTILCQSFSSNTRLYSVRS
jgi:hypothetical protein